MAAPAMRAIAAAGIDGLAPLFPAHHGEHHRAHNQEKNESYKYRTHDYMLAFFAVSLLSS